jgi:hypothetical protein
MHLHGVEGRMKISPLEAWRRLVADKDIAGVDSLLAENVVFHSPVVDTPQVGKAITPAVPGSGPRHLLETFISLCP